MPITEIDLIAAFILGGILGAHAVFFAQDLAAHRRKQRRGA
jgi:hypothetical protein